MSGAKNITTPYFTFDEPNQVTIMQLRKASSQTAVQILLSPVGMYGRKCGRLFRIIWFLQYHRCIYDQVAIARTSTVKHYYMTQRY